MNALNTPVQKIYHIRVRIHFIQELHGCFRMFTGGRNGKTNRVYIRCLDIWFQNLDTFNFHTSTGCDLLCLSLFSFDKETCCPVVLHISQMSLLSCGGILQDITGLIPLIRIFTELFKLICSIHINYGTIIFWHQNTIIIIQIIRERNSICI